MTKKSQNPKTILKNTNRGRSASPKNNRASKKVHIEEVSPQQTPPVELIASSSSGTSPNDMEVDPKASNIEDKGKGPEITPLVEKPPLDQDQSYDASENMLNDEPKKKGIYLERD